MALPATQGPRHQSRADPGACTQTKNSESSQACDLRNHRNHRNRFHRYCRRDGRCNESADFHNAQMIELTDIEFTELLNRVFDGPVYSTYTTEHKFRATYQSPATLQRRNRCPGNIAGAPRSAVESAPGLSPNGRDLLAKLVAASSAQTKKWWLNESAHLGVK